MESPTEKKFWVPEHPISEEAREESGCCNFTVSGWLSNLHVQAWHDQQS